MNKKTGYVLILIFIAVIAAGIIVSAVISNENSSEILAVNHDVIRSAGFSVNSGSIGQNTSAAGTVFVCGPGETAENIRIAARVEVDPGDWGGVAFYVPAGWKVSGVLSSYPEGDDRSRPSDYAATWTTTDEKSEWSSWVEIGRIRGGLPAAGGNGTVVIDLVPDKASARNISEPAIMVGAGSEEKDGIKIMETGLIKVPV
ncbi:hypothetical protein J2128_000415 [Methanomicrobium sp. W14]|uniref:hypothetical protein n=1 Tax=Methanomicrobium sp. W14 TaxID=2817839 RepID=UPI001AE34239|nr:hypothetical protein [Methanomicrobium sp. W14]MBP2132494.1 hypothetical protein [Methanomicrobium sp. W14]